MSINPKISNLTLLVKWQYSKDTIEILKKFDLEPHE